MEVVHAVPLWRASLRATGMSERTIESYVNHVVRFACTCERITVLDLRSKQIAEYGVRLGHSRSPRTVGLFYSSMRSFCRWCIDAELRADDPTLRLRYPKKARTLPKPLTRDQIAVLVYNLRQPVGLPDGHAYYWKRNRLICYLMLYAGLRISEVSHLKWGDVSNGVLTVRQGKGSSDRSIPLHPVLKQELSDETLRRGVTVATSYRGDPMGRKGINHVFDRWIPREIGSELGFSFTAHQLRHSFATYMVASGANIMAVRDLMGHQDVKTTQQYLELDASHLRPAVDSLPHYW